MAQSAFLAGGFTDLSIGVTPITGGVPYSILTTGPLGTILQQITPGANGDVLTIVGGIPTYAPPTPPSETLGIFMTASPATASAASTYYMSLNGIGLTTVESAIQTNSFVGTLSEMKLRVTTNTCDGATVVAIRVNGVTQTPSITIGAGATGNFTDIIPFTVADNDLISIIIDTSASTVGTISINPISNKFTT